ncbi:MAG: GNAT family N-acetyltransferase [Rhodospirillaceae bacterium]
MHSSAAIEHIRAASRRLVREFGFMQKSLAGTDLPPSAVHALIEIDARPGITAGEIAARLRLEKSSVSRMLRKLVESGDVREEAGVPDARTKALFLSAAGQARVAGIHAFARAQAAEALERLTPQQCKTVLQGLTLYAAALGGDVNAPPPAPVLRIETGYRPGLIGRIAEMHALHYARTAGFGQPFEAVVAAGLAAFSGRIGRPGNQIWLAMRGEEIVGTVSVDGEDLGPGIAHLRWFIVGDGLRGHGLGRDLLAAALRFADDHGFAETHLWTFRGLDAARHLYEAHGFALAEEKPGAQWGKEVMEQRFVRRKP